MLGYVCVEIVKNDLKKREDKKLYLNPSSEIFLIPDYCYLNEQFKKKCEENENMKNEKLDFPVEINLKSDEFLSTNLTLRPKKEEIVKFYGKKEITILDQLNYKEFITEFKVPAIYPAEVKELVQVFCKFCKKW